MVWRCNYDYIHSTTLLFVALRSSIRHGFLCFFLVPIYFYFLNLFHYHDICLIYVTAGYVTSNHITRRSVAEIRQFHRIKFVDLFIFGSFKIPQSISAEGKLKWRIYLFYNGLNSAQSMLRLKKTSIYRVHYLLIFFNPAKRSLICHYPSISAL